MENEVIETIKNTISFITAINKTNLKNDISLKEYYKIDIWEFHEIIFSLEEKFDVEIADECDSLDTINDLCELIIRKLENL